MALGASGESSLTLMSVGSGSPARGEPLLQWADPQDPTSMLFTLDTATESMERESLDVGITFMLKALDHARAHCTMSLFPPTGYCLVLLLSLFFL